MQKLPSDELGRPDLATHKNIPKLPVVVVLDNVRSALNVGSFFRTCDAFGISSLYLCGITASPPHKEIQKTAIGATESVDWRYFNHTTEAIQQLNHEGYRVIGIEHTDQSTSLSSLDLTLGESYALVFGNEVDGISDEVIKQLNEAVEIEQFGTKHSLNVAVCGGIVIHQVSRRLRNQG